MRRILVILYILLSQVSFAQIPQDKVLYQHKKGLLIETKTLIIPKGEYYILEKYSYGLGMFGRYPYTDSLLLKNDSLIGQKTSFFAHKSKYFEITEKGKKHRIKFVTLDSCNFNINRTRNYTYQERHKYLIYDSIRSNFGVATRNLDFGYYRFQDYSEIPNYCHDEYVEIINSIFDNSLKLISLELSARKKRFEEYILKRNVVIDSVYIYNFLNEFVSCKYDQDIFYDLIINYTDSFLNSLSKLSDKEYLSITTNLIAMPLEFDSKLALSNIEQSKVICKHKTQFVKDMKKWWR